MYAPKVKLNGRGKALGQHRLRRARYPLQEDMPVGDKRGQQKVHCLVLTDDRLGDLGLQVYTKYFNLFEIHAASPFSNDELRARLQTTGAFPYWVMKRER